MAVTDLDPPIGQQPTSPIRVFFLLLPGVHLLDLSGAVQVFYEADQLGGSYEVRYVGASRRIRSAQGLELAAVEPLPEVRRSDIVVVPGTDSRTLDMLPAAVPVVWLRQAQAAGATVCSICTGAFALGFAGMLDGRECTTHWKVVERLARDAPRARVLADRLFVQDGPIFTSAGVASGIDLALSMIEQRDGPLVAARVARELVVYLRRDGSRGQASIYLEYRTHLHPGIHRAQDWLVDHPTANPSLDELAAVAGMSPRHLTRRFRELTGISAKEFSHRLKVEVARNLLGNPRLTVETVAARCGFDDPRQLRRLWRRHFGTSPASWRERQRLS